MQQDLVDVDPDANQYHQKGEQEKEQHREEDGDSHRQSFGQTKSMAIVYIVQNQLFA